MSLESIAAGLFNFDPTEGLVKGTSMGAQMMQIALEEQRMKFDVAGKAADAMLQGQRNDLSRRSQMFNELTQNLNRFDEKAREGQASAWNRELAGKYLGGGGESSGGGGDGPSSEASYSPPIEQASPSEEASGMTYEAAGDFNTMPEGGNVEPSPTPSAPAITSVQPTVQAIGSDGATVQDPGTGFSAAPTPAPGPSISTIQGRSTMARPGRGQDGMGRREAVRGSRVANTNVLPQGSFSGGAQAVPTFPGRQNSVGFQEELPNFLETDANSKVDPIQLHGYMRQRVANSKLNGLVPRDGERFGITTGAPEEWANYFVGLGEYESGFGSKVVGDVGRFPGNSNGLYQLSPNDAMGHKIRDTPFTMTELQDATFNADAAVKIHENLVTQDGVIAEGNRGAARYWGPLRRGVRPQLAGSVASLAGASPGGMPEAGGGPDGSLFPNASPEPGQSTDQPAVMDIPEAAPVEEARRGVQATFQEKSESVRQLSLLRSKELELAAAMAAIDPNDPSARMLAGQLGVQRAKVRTDLQAAEERNHEIKQREAVLQKALIDAEKAHKIALDRQRSYQREVPGAGRQVSPEDVFDAYVDADPRTRMKMKARFVNDKEMTARINVADEFLERQDPTDDRTWNIGGSDYTVADMAEFYNAPDVRGPDGLKKPNPVKEFVEKNPKLKREVEALAGVPAAAPATEAAPAPGLDPVKAKIDGVF
jgi:hypothetical protein